MAGYLGTKAVLLSTTAADVTGNAEIGGDLTVGGNLTSTGIDDNAASTAITIDGSQNVGIGTSSPQRRLSITQPADGNGIRINHAARATSTFWDIELSGPNNEGLVFAQNNGSSTVTSYAVGRSYHIFAVNGSDAVTIDSSGNVLVGGTTARSGSKIVVDGGAADTFIHLDSDSFNGTYESGIRFSSNTFSGTNYYQGEISFKGNNNYSGDLIFSTAASGTTNAPTEAMRIDSSGRLLVGMSSPSVDTPGFYADANGTIVACRSASDVAIFNRQTNDGTIILFRQGTSNEGTISVSGSTVSYNGGHLARWSQLADGSKDTSFLKGTVLTNLDQMAVWSHNAVAATYYEDGDELPDGASVGDEKTPAADSFTESNEQLNCMAVSSVEGDPNVSGVFVNWDEDDDIFHNDMNIAMTGDMIIRIAQGTTVQRGDLLMSAGDGTAKPQSDDIVRGKTIAKVTSTHVTCTYEDGSYCVPCVLMAC